MIQISVYKNDVLSNQAKFENDDKAQAWLAKEKANHSFGKPAGEYPIQDLSVEELFTEISRHEDDFGDIYITIPDQFRIETEDVTDSDNFDKAVQKGIENQSKGASCIAMIYAMNELKFANGDLTQEAFMSFMSDPQVAMVERLLRGGALESAKLMIQSLELDFTEDEKAKIIAFLS